LHSGELCWGGDKGKYDADQVAGECGHADCREPLPVKPQGESTDEAERDEEKGTQNQGVQNFLLE